MKIKHLIGLASEFLDFYPSDFEHEVLELEKHSSNKPIVVLVSGFGVGRRSLSIFRRRFSEAGYDVAFFSLTDPHWLRGLEYYADRLSQLIVELRKSRTREKSRIYVVAHSAGGLVARDVMQRNGGFHYVDALVTLGTPHSGTWHALLGLFTPLLMKARVLFDICPWSTYLAKLNARELPSDYAFLSLYSTQDLVCSPVSCEFSGWLEKHAKHKQHALTNITHTSFLTSRSVFQLVVQFFDKASVSQRESFRKV